jgi:phage tail sheath protein FI
MAQVSYPGVYVEEIPSGVRTITGVATSIAAFFGRTLKGPTNRAVRCTSLSDFYRTFGGGHPESDLEQSLIHFFTNGGMDCYVVRLEAGGQAAAITLQDPQNRNVLTATARSNGLWGNGIRLEVDYNTLNPDDTFNLTVIQLDGADEVGRERHANLSMDPHSARFAPAIVSQNSSLINLTLHVEADAGGPHDIHDPANSHPGFSQSRPFVTTPIGDFRTEFEALLTNTPNFSIQVNDEQVVDIGLDTVLGTGPGQIQPGSAWQLVDMADRLSTVISEQLNAAVAGLAVQCSWLTSGDFSLLRIAAASGTSHSVTITRATTDDFALPALLGLDQGGIEVNRYSGYRPVPSASFLSDVDTIVELAALTRDQVTSISIDGEPSVNLDFSALSPDAGDSWIIDSSGDPGDGIRQKLRRVVSDVNNATSLPWQAELWGYHLAFMATDGSINRTASDVTTAGSAVLGDAVDIHNVRQYGLGTTGTSTFQDPAENIPGIDGTAPQLDDFVGSEIHQTGFHALDPVDLFNLMVIPGDEGISEAVHHSLWAPASTYCQSRRAFLLIDAPPSWTANGRPAVVQDTTVVNDLRVGLVNDHAAVFYPRISVGFNETVGASGAMAGLMARIDSSRGVWKTPAGMGADLRGVSGLEVKLTDMENGVLNRIGVNCIRVFPVGIVCWGGRTLDGHDDFGSEWKYISIRRTALFLEESLYRGTQWVVFEANDEPLWAKIRMNVGAFMNSLFRQGAFQGSTPKEAYFVKCDAETTTQNDRNQGIVNILVGFAPLKPAEFVVIKIQQIAGEL